MVTRYLLLAAKILGGKLISPLRRAADIITDYDPEQKRGQPGNAGQFAKSDGAGGSKKSEPEAKKGLRLGKKEYGRVVSAINTLFRARFAGASEGYIANGNYIYRFKINEFGDYVFLKKAKIK